MVKKSLKFFAYFLFFIFALMVFIPKTSIYYLLEEKLNKFEVVISDERLTENIFSLGVKDLTLNVKGIESATAKEAEILLLGLYNRVAIKDIAFSPLLETYFPLNVEELELSYTPLNPLVIKAEGNGLFGDIHASFNLVDNNLSLILTPTNMMLKKYKKSLKQFKKSKKGEYIYAKTF